MGWAYQQVATLGTPEIATLTPPRRLVPHCAAAAPTKHHAPATYNTHISGLHCPGPGVNRLQQQAG